MQWILRLYIYVLVGIFGLVVFHAPLSVWFGVQLPAYDLLIKSWKEIIFVLLFPVGVFLAWKKGILKQLLHDKLFILIGGYALLHIVLAFVFQPELPALVAGLMIDLRYLLFFMLVYIALRLMPQYVNTFLWAGVIAAGVSLTFAVLQVFLLPPDFLKVIGYGRDTIETHLLVDDNPDFVRVNGTLRGPNPLGAYTVMVLSLLAGFVLKVRMKGAWLRVLVIWLGAASVVALWASYSRSALIAALIGIAIVAGLIFAHKVPVKFWLVGIILVGALAGLGIYAARDTALVQNVFLHDNESTGGAATSNEEHVASLQTGLERMLAQPLGAGPGSTGSASLYGSEPLIIENQYLFVAHESGWLGIVLFVWIYGLVLWRLWRQPRTWLSMGVLASGIGLAAIGLLQPVWADDTVSLVWWGLAGVALAVSSKHTKNLAQRSKKL